MQPLIGILGAGAFGRFVAGHLAAHGRVLIHDSDQAKRAKAEADGVQTVADIAGMTDCDYVVLCIPWRAIGEAAACLAAMLKPQCVIVDVASIKVVPLDSLGRSFPRHRIVGLHPLFGPQSGANGIAGMPVALCTTGLESRRIARFLRMALSLRVLRMSAEDHDRQMGAVQGLTHAIARTLMDLDLPEPVLTTRSYDHLLTMRAIVGGDSDAVFRTVLADNVAAMATVRRFHARLGDILAKAGEDSGLAII